ncbi:MAG: BamA/TamA family outer membrane protein [Salinivenus sp.]
MRTSFLPILGVVGTKWAWGRGIVLAILLGWGAWAGGAQDAWAQQPGAVPGAEGGEPDTTQPIVRSVQVEGNQHFSTRELKRQIRTRHNRRVLDIPGFTWWRWIYRLGDADWMWSRVGNALKSGGEPPATLDTTTVAGDVERLRLFYEQQGFRDATVEYDVRRSARDRATVVFQVEAGPPTYLRRVRYEGLDSLTAAQKRQVTRETVLNARSIDPSDPLSFSVEEQRYQKPQLLEERRRLLTVLQNAGYAAVSRDSIRAVLVPVPPESLDTAAGPDDDATYQDLTFRVQTGPVYRFGDVHFQVTGPESAPPRRDTLDVPGDRSGRRPVVTSEIENDTQLGTGVLRRSLQFTPGAVYDRSRILSTKQRLEGTGVFTFTSLTPQYDEASSSDTVEAPYLPIEIEGRTRPRHRLRAETFALQRGAEAVGLNEFGVGLSGVYENANAFGGGEALRLQASGSIATGLDTTLISSTQLETAGSVTLPYLVRPFQSFESLFDLSSARTQVSLSALTARRNDLRLRIRSRINARLRLEMNHTPDRQSLVDVMDLSLSNPDTLAGFQERFLDRVFGPDGAGIQDPVQRQQILEDYTRPQINTSPRYTLRSATANPLRRRSGHIYEGTAEVGNTIPFLLDRFVFSPGAPSYTLPGLTGGGEGLGGRLLYRPYVRATVDLRRYVPLGNGSTLAMKAFGGAAHPTGSPTVVPFDRRFFSGGANSVRGWRLRDLGPGDAGLPVDSAGTIGPDASGILGGDLKLESSVEVRTRLLQNLLAAEWVGAAFVDVGNMWFGPRNRGFGQADGDPEADLEEPAESAVQDGRFRSLRALTEVGVGAGLGIRIEWDYVIIRFDLAHRMRDPSPRNDDVFSDSYRGPLFHFGIGQAF